MIYNYIKKNISDEIYFIQRKNNLNTIKRIFMDKNIIICVKNIKIL